MGQAKGDARVKMWLNGKRCVGGFLSIESKDEITLFSDLSPNRKRETVVRFWATRESNIDQLALVRVGFKSNQKRITVPNCTVIDASLCYSETDKAAHNIDHEGPVFLVTAYVSASKEDHYTVQL